MNDLKQYILLVGGGLYFRTSDGDTTIVSYYQYTHFCDARRWQGAFNKIL